MVTEVSAVTAEVASPDLPPGRRGDLRSRWRPQSDFIAGLINLVMWPGDYLSFHDAQQAGGMLAARMEQTAAHAGMPGAYPYSTMNGGRIGPATQAQRGAGTAASPERQTGQPGQAH